MSFDKSKDWKLQISPITLWYMRKTAEGDATFNTNSESAFKAAAEEIPYCVHNSGTRSSPEFIQGDKEEFYIWRDKWIDAFEESTLPCISDKLFWNGKFWLVDDVTYTDKDDSGFFQRYKVTCTGSNRSVEA